MLTVRRTSPRPVEGCRGRRDRARRGSAARWFVTNAGPLRPGARPFFRAAGTSHRGMARSGPGFSASTLVILASRRRVGCASRVRPLTRMRERFSGVGNAHPHRLQRRARTGSSPTRGTARESGLTILVLSGRYASSSECRLAPCASAESATADLRIAGAISSECIRYRHRDGRRTLGHAAQLAERAAIGAVACCSRSVSKRGGRASWRWSP